MRSRSDRRVLTCDHLSSDTISLVPIPVYFVLCDLMMSYGRYRLCKFINLFTSTTAIQSGRPLTVSLTAGSLRICCSQEVAAAVLNRFPTTSMRSTISIAMWRVAPPAVK